VHLRPFDIFRRLADGTPRWVSSSDSLGEAKMKIAELGLTEKSTYAIWEASTNSFVVPFPPTKASLPRTREPMIAPAR
jgi:hypothetical protein